MITTGTLTLRDVLGGTQDYTVEATDKYTCIGCYGPAELITRNDKGEVALVACKGCLVQADNFISISV